MESQVDAMGSTFSSSNLTTFLVGVRGLYTEDYHGNEGNARSIKVTFTAGASTSRIIQMLLGDR